MSRVICNSLVISWTMFPTDRYTLTCWKFCSSHQKNLAKYWNYSTFILFRVALYAATVCRCKHISFIWSILWVTPQWHDLCWGTWWFKKNNCMGSCLIKGSQTCSQTCSSLAPLEVNAHNSNQLNHHHICIYIKWCIGSFIFHVQVWALYKSRLVQMHQHISEFERTQHAFSFISDTAYRTIHSPSCLYTLYLYQLTDRFIINLQSSPTCRQHFGVLLFLQPHSIRWQQNYLDQSFSGAPQSLTGLTQITKSIKKKSLYWW